MADKKITIPRFVIKGPKAKAQRVCTLSIRRVPLDGLEKEIEQVMEMASKSGAKFTHVRGTIVCY